MAGWLGERLTKWSNERDNDDYNLFGGIESGLSGVNTYGNAARSTCRARERRILRCRGWV